MAYPFKGWACLNLRGHGARIMDTTLALDGELLRRYDRPGPRYTSYPTAPQFSERFGEEQFRAYARRSNAGRPPRPLSVYVHVPFCFSPCFYCGCNRIITRDAERGAKYLERLLRELAAVAPLFSRGRPVLQVHFGGGTPNFLEAGQLARLWEGLDRQLDLTRAADRDYSLELDPRFVTPGLIPMLAGLGVNRVSLGVQDFDPAVQAAINRFQSVEETLAVIDSARASGIRSVNVDLIYGLPRQNLAGFDATLRTIIEARPDRLAIYGYAHLPELFKAQRQLDASELPTPELRLDLLRLAIERLGEAGYRYIGMDHFALPEDELSVAQDAGGLQRNFMGYTTHGDCDLIGLGVSAISHVDHSFSQNHRDLPSWEAAIDAGRLPVWRGLELDFDDVLRADLIQQLMCRGAADIADIERRYGIRFNTYFGNALARVNELVADGLARVDEQRVAATLRGRALVRLIAMCFDRYLEHPAEGSRPVRFSKVV